MEMVIHFPYIRVAIAFIIPIEDVLCVAYLFVFPSLKLAHIAAYARGRRDVSTRFLRIAHSLHALADVDSPKPQRPKFLRPACVLLS